MKLKSQDAEQK